MSFTATPLGTQNKRLDHNTFFGQGNKRPPNSPPTRSIQTSYSFTGAPSVARSPAKHSQPTHDQDNPDEPALVRFEKHKQRTKASGLHPEKWTVKDTSVQIANAFHQAATGDTSMPPTNPNDSWASGANRKGNLPRSTSVEYEKETQSTTIRRLNAPPPTNRVPPRRTIVKSTSIQHVPDSEDEEPQIVTQLRGKSPFEHVADAARSVLKPATFFMVRRSQDPEELNGKDGSSYDYAEEEQEFQQQQLPPQPKPPSKRHAHKRGRMSVDNKAYRPSASDLEQSDEDPNDEKRVRRKKKNKKDPVGGPLTSLPVAGYDKRRRRKKNAKGDGEGEGEDEEDDEEGSETDEQEKSSEHRASVHRASAPRTIPTQPLRSPDPPDPHDQLFEGEISMDVEQGLNSIPELDESFDADLDDNTPSPAVFSIGGFLGRIVNFIIRAIIMMFSSLFRFLGYITWLFGQALGVAFKTPKDLLNSVNFAAFAWMAFGVASIYIIWYSSHNRSFGIPSISWNSSPRAPYQAPSIPASDLVELSTRLQALEAALSSLSQDNERARLRLESELNRGNSDLVGKLGVLETKIQKDSARALEAEAHFRQSASQGIKSVKQEIEVLQSQIFSAPSRGERDGNDEEARTRLKLLEERVGSVEGGVKEALELGKNTVKVGTSASAAAWWNKLASGNSASSLTIKSADGQDVSSLITHLVESAASRYSKDILARPDFALNSGGATVIPSLTSPTYEIRPVGAANQILGFVTGSGHAVGRPPVTALHHDINNGHCWPFAGTQGQLGVKLSWPAVVMDVTIDHVAKDVAFDMRSAPREMELWGLVEGKDNIAKLKRWLAEKQEKKEAALAAGKPIRPEDEEWVYPQSLPRNVYYARIASFTYDIHSPTNIQTYPVSEDIRDLGIDFGLVVLFVKNNWGRQEFTCLYRFRVHGEQAGEIPAPYTPEAEAP